MINFLTQEREALEFSGKLQTLSNEIYKRVAEIEEDCVKEFLATQSIHTVEELKANAHRANWIIHHDPSVGKTLQWDGKDRFNVQVDVMCGVVKFTKLPNYYHVKP